MGEAHYPLGLIMLKFVTLVVRWFRAAVRLPSLRQVLLPALRKSFANGHTLRHVMLPVSLNVHEFGIFETINQYLILATEY